MQPLSGERLDSKLRQKLMHQASLKETLNRHNGRKSHAPRTVQTTLRYRCKQTVSEQSKCWRGIQKLSIYI